MECVEKNSDSKADLNMFIIIITLESVIFFIALYLNYKIVMVSRQEKDERSTWKIDICHSVVLLTRSSFTILLRMITYIIPSLHQYTGKWLCYVAMFIASYCTFSIFSHSLVISIHKYMFIVHQNRIIAFGKDKASLISFWINLIFPAVLAVARIAKPISSLDGHQNPVIYNCLGKPAELAANSNETLKEKIQRVVFLVGEFDGYDDYFNDRFFGHFINVVNMIGRFLTVMLLCLIMANIMEGFLYRKIFSYIKR